MTAPSERPPDAGAETRPAEEPAQEENSVMQVLKDSTNLLIAFGGVATVVTLIFTWAILGSSNSEKWLAVGGATAIAVSWTCGCRLLKTKQLSNLVGVSMSSIGIACICVTAAVLHPGEMQTPMRGKWFRI